MEKDKKNVKGLNKEKKENEKKDEKMKYNWFRKRTLYRFQESKINMMIYTYTLDDFEHIMFHEIIDKISDDLQYDRLVILKGQGRWFSPLKSYVEYKLEENKIVDFNMIRNPHNVRYAHKIEKKVHSKGNIKDVNILVFVLDMMSEKTSGRITQDDLKELLQDMNISATVIDKKKKENEEEEDLIKIKINTNDESSEIGSSIYEDEVSEDIEFMKILYDHIQDRLSFAYAKDVVIKSRVEFIPDLKKKLLGSEEDIRLVKSSLVTEMIEKEAYGLDKDTGKLIGIVQTSSMVLKFSDFSFVLIKV